MPDDPLVAVTRRLPAPCEERLKAKVRVRLGDDAAVYTPAALARHAEGATVLIVSPAESLDGTAIAALPKSVKALATFSVGTDHIDLDAARRRSLTVTNTPGVLTDATADIAMLLLLATARRASEGERLMRSGAWTGWRPTQLMGLDLAGKTLGIVGMGRIGMAVAKRARAFGLRVLYHNRRPIDDATTVDAPYIPTLDDLLRNSQILSLHCPLSPDTKGLLDTRRLALLPRGAVVVNTARGGLIIDDALITALLSGHIAAAGLDVYAGEPNIDPRYLSLPNIVLLPHLGSATLETRVAMGMMVLDNVEAILQGRPPPNPVVIEPFEKNAFVP